MCSHFDNNLDDPISEIFPDLQYCADKAARSVDLPAPSVGFTENCRKCGGRGRFIGYTGRDLGPCFTCKGAGKQTFKTSADDRAKKQAQVAVRKLNRVEEWQAANPVEAAWISKKSGSFEFAQAMAEALAKYGSLTERQLAAVRKCALADADRAERNNVERTQREAAATDCDVCRIEEAFAVAQGNGIKRPQLRLDTFKFKPAGPNSRNPGAVYVTEDDTYLGKVQGGRFTRSRDCTADQEARIVAAASDPAASAKAYGQRTGSCSICARELTRAESIDRAMGPICAERYGW